jgi:N-acetylated-alpha-linked acidic dipeptidase
MFRRLGIAPLLIPIAMYSTATAGFGQDEQPACSIGFTPASRAAEAKAEARAIAVPTPENARSWLRILTAEPHVAGTLADYRTAVFVRDKLREWGWEAELAEYEVLLNYPFYGNASPGDYSTPRLELIQPIQKKLPLIETANPADKDSASQSAFPAFHGYGVSGDVSGQVVYANFGRIEDFAVLEKLGISIKDKIVLVRYGDLFRGLKIRNAQQRGAKGVLIYSDPADDGYARGDVYPNGPYRPGSAIQRGSVQFLSLGPGDPSTPKGPSVKGADRLPIDLLNGFPVSRTAAQSEVKAWEKTTGLVRNDYYASIPSLPISYDAARPILESLGGPNVPREWQGGLPLPYHVGPGPAEVHFEVRMDYKVRTIWNVIASLKGTVEPDRWVIVGNHRDAWVYGAVDPNSGTASTLEMCRALGSAVKSGWKPRRTIVYASWDAEEYGLVGSTEWAEEHAKEVSEKAVLMLNVDSAVGGHELSLDGVPSLRDFMIEAADAIPDPRTGKLLGQSWVEKRRSSWASNASFETIDPLWDQPTTSSSATDRPAPRFSPQLDALGSGSDYTAFLDNLGVPALDVGFGGRYGVYHSIYDNFYWMEKFCDPEFLTHATSARLYTVIVMRAASADVVPFKFTPYGEALREYVDDLRKIVERRIRAASPVQGKPPIAFEKVIVLARSIRAFQAQAETLDQATAGLISKDGVDPSTLARVNDALKKVERAFLLSEGLPGRPWFKHSVYAPGLTTGYACWPLPGVRQAILENDGAMLASQSALLIDRIDAAAAAMKAATETAKADNGRATRGGTVEPRTPSR